MERVYRIDTCEDVQKSNENQQEIIAKFGPECTILEYNYSDGTHKTKRVDTAEFCKMLGNKSVSYINYLPPSCRGFGVKGAHTQAYLLVYGPQHHKSFLLWDKKGVYTDNIPTEEECKAVGISKSDRYRVFDVPYPPLVFMVIVSCNEDSIGKKNYTLQSQYVWAIKDINADLANMELFRYPFTNIFEDGRCCLGHGYTNTVGSLNGILYFPTLVFNGIGNYDLTCNNGSHFDNTNYEQKPFGKILSEHAFMAKLNGQTSFPLEYLKKEGATAKERFDNLLNSVCDR